MTTDATIFTGATEPLADWHDTRDDALADLLLAEPDHYERREIVQRLYESDDELAFSMDCLADRIDEDEREQRMGRAS